MYRYAYSEEVGEDSDDEEAQSLTKGKQEGQGELSLVRQEKNGGTDVSFDQEDESEEEDKREWALKSFLLTALALFLQLCSATLHEKCCKILFICTRIVRIRFIVYGITV